MARAPDGEAVQGDFCSARRFLNGHDPSSMTKTEGHRPLFQDRRRG
jgi:hypothetical protein